MKRIIFGGILAALIFAGLIIGYGNHLASSNKAGYVNIAKIFAATKSYTTNLKSHDQTIPDSVSVDELIAQKLLRREDVSGFAGERVTISLRLDESNPQAVLMRARMTDGNEIVALADGSVQQIEKDQPLVFGALVAGLPDFYECLC